MSTDFAQPFVLYMSTYSLCSLQTLFTLALRGHAKAGVRPIIVEEREIDIVYTVEQLDEEFMLHVNPKAQVPVLVNPQEFPNPLTESLDMAKFFISRYPALGPPPEHADEGERLLDELHGLDYFTLSFARLPTIATSTLAACEAALKKAVSSEHRRVLEKKIEVYKSHKGREITEQDIKDTNTTVLQYLGEIRLVAQRTDGPWIYGMHGPTALDAHLIVFLQRMKDTGHADFFDDSLMQYLEHGTSILQWYKMMHGRKTFPEAILETKKSST